MQLLCHPHAPRVSAHTQPRQSTTMLTSQAVNSATVLHEHVLLLLLIIRSGHTQLLLAKAFPVCCPGLLLPGETLRLILERTACNRWIGKHAGRKTWLLLASQVSERCIASVHVHHSPNCHTRQKQQQGKEQPLLIASIFQTDLFTRRRRNSRPLHSERTTKCGCLHVSGINNHRRGLQSGPHFPTHLLCYCSCYCQRAVRVIQKQVKVITLSGYKVAYQF